MPPRWSNTGPHNYKSLRGTRGKGQTFERRVGKLLQAKADEWGWTLHSHRWIELEDGSGWLQPDFVLQCSPNRAVIFECKLTWVDCSAQLRKYASALTRMGIVCTSVLVCRHLTPAFVGTLCVAFEDISKDAVWHLLL